MSGRCQICGGASTCPAGLYKRVREVGEGEINIFPRWEDVPRGWKVTHAKKRGYYALPVQVGEWELVVVGTAQASRVRAHYGISPRWVGQCRYAFYAIPAAPGEVLYGLVWRRRWVDDPFDEPLPPGTRPVAADPVGRWLVLCNRCGAWAWRGIAPAEGGGRACVAASGRPSSSRSRMTAPSHLSRSDGGPCDTSSSAPILSSMARPCVQTAE